MAYPGIRFQATGTIAAVGNTSLLAAASGATHYVTKIVVTISVQTASAILSLDDGTTTYFAWTATSGNAVHAEITFDKDNAFSWGTGKAIRLVDAGANATCHVTVMGYTKQG